MFFSKIITSGFRNLREREVDTRGKDIFLVGPNGQGKTNFLEAVYFCSYASSFRASKNAELIGETRLECHVRAVFFDFFERNISASIKNDKKQILLDEKKIDRRELLSIFSSIVFCHEDLEYVSGTQERRRWFFDQNLCLYDKLYLDTLQRYKKILKTRNVILKEVKEGKDSAILDAIDPQFVKYGLELVKKREEEIQYFSMIFKEVYRAVSGIDGIEIEYGKSWKTEIVQDIIDKLSAQREREIIMGMTLSGPHRDKYLFIKDKNEFDLKASTGQKRLLALLLRVAQASRYYEMTKKEPVLLLDDVLLELDGEKRKTFLKVLPPYKQAFYTFLPEEPYEQYKKSDTIIYYVKQGDLTNEKNW
jgi:DNA replication and repair protein RecF